MRTKLFCLVAVCAVAAANAGAPEGAAQGSSLSQLQAMTARYAPVKVNPDLQSLPANERAALAKLVEAAKLVDAIFLRQNSEFNESQLLDLAADTSELGAARLHYFLINKGPWSDLDLRAPFLPGVGPKPPGANLYPSDATREEVDTWIKSLSGSEKEAATGFFTTIRRDSHGKLISVPYSLEYQGELMQMSRLLHEAASLTMQPTLKTFLDKRAAAFLSNDYYESDIAWMDLDASIEPTIGPYEVYQDEWFNYKAAFEAFITLTDRDETQKLRRFSDELQRLEDHLPIDPQYRVKLGGYAPIRVVNVVYNSGDANHGVQTVAFNLPNDERVVAQKGSKRVLLKNFQHAKFDQILVPISRVALAPADQPLVAFDPFFTHILMHELMHGLGPQTIVVNGRQTTVRQELKELNGQLEEAKADISGLWALQYLMDTGVLDKKQERAVYATFFASTFRTLRFGLSEAHAKGMALQVNYLLDHGALRVDNSGAFSIDMPKMKRAVAGLTHDIMTLQAHGDYAGVDALLKRMVVIRPEIQRVLDQLKGVPIDIEPRFAVQTP